MQPISSPSFEFKQFSLHQDRCAMKVGTDGILMGAWADVRGVKRALDIGTGTGLIALMLAQRAPASEVIALEIDAQAAAQARENVAASPFKRQIKIQPESLQGYIPEASFDLIVSNPPFFKAGIPSPDMRRQRARHESSIGLKDILEFAAAHLHDHGRLAVILPLGRWQELVEQGRSHGLYVSRFCEVFSRPGKPAHRMLAELGFRQRVPLLETLWLRAEDGGFSPAYQNLTRDFHPFL
ncbi:MAG: methyltransferase [Bacteroidota bacterium]